ncbi:MULTISPECIES: hypothetical protein [Paenibacillus]|uniref:hypothetical protein n=1 Tax=Paenibacillus TaxID=44249 RepID=UPI0012FD6BD8|nr:MULTISPECIES: hypothetical protein [Paenibacillus]GIP24836.1 hypothetical protein J22TS3_51110 [Paenibacillus sp. J22TS3]
MGQLVTGPGNENVGLSPVQRVTHQDGMFIVVLDPAYIHMDALAVDLNRNGML